MAITVQLHPPLNSAAGWDRVSLEIASGSTLGVALEALAERFGPGFRRHLYDTAGRVIPAWCAFINGRPVQLNRPQNLATVLEDGDELSLLLNIAGG